MQRRRAREKDSRRKAISGDRERKRKDLCGQRDEDQVVKSEVGL